MTRRRFYAWIREFINIKVEFDEAKITRLADGLALTNVSVNKSVSLSETEQTVLASESTTKETKEG